MEYFWYIVASDILGPAVTTATYIRHKNIDLRRGWIMLVCIIGMCTVCISTFIMTFTALIASVSHILIHPAILLERWRVLLLCVTVATAASLAFARFANRVDSRTPSRSTLR